MTRYKLLPLFLFFAVFLSPLQAQGYREKAEKAIGGWDWAGLKRIASEALKKNPKDLTAKAYLAYAEGCLKHFGKAVEILKEIEAAGQDMKGTLPGFGNPVTRIIEAFQTQCWTDFRPKYNHIIWKDLFEAFPGVSMDFPASRLLMAALGMKDQKAIARFKEYFESRIAKAKGGNALYYKKLYLQAYLDADVMNAEILALSREVFEEGKKRLERKKKFSVINMGGGSSLEEADKDAIEMEPYARNLARACFLYHAFDPGDNPIAAGEAEPSVRFTDVTKKRGLEGFKGEKVAVGDFNGDRWPDLCFSGTLLENMKGKGFKDVTKKSGLGRRGTGALFADYDNDGYLDILVTASPHPVLYRNTGKKGNFKFVDVTKASGLALVKLGAPVEGAAWLDIDNDGWLDLYLAVYEGPTLGHGNRDVLLKNNGDGTFRDDSEGSGISKAPSYCGRGVCVGDFDNDGDQDIYVGNYRLQPNFLWVNDGKGHFKEMASFYGIQGKAGPRGKWMGHTIGVCWGDIDNDGFLDLLVPNLAHPQLALKGVSNLTMLYVNRGKRGKKRFSEERLERGIRYQETHSGGALVDFDNDGDLDASLTCVYLGHPSSLWQNDGKGYFKPVTFRTRSVTFNSLGQAWFDYDRDGDLDLLAASWSGMRLLENSGNENGWLHVLLKRKKRNTFCVGARVTVTLVEKEGAPRMIREVRAGRGATSQDGYVLCFGLGDYKGKIIVSAKLPDMKKPKRRFLRKGNRYLVIKW